MKLDLYTQTGDKKGTVDASDKLFKVPVNEELVRLSVVRQMANARHPLAHVKTRADVRGGGKKPWRQKGTGRARFGSSRNPVWRSGGVAFGPSNEQNFSLNMSKKARRNALFSCLSYKAQEKKTFALDSYEADKPKTKDFSELLSKLPVDKNLLIVLSEKNTLIEKSAGNLPNVKVILVDYLNPYDLLHYDSVMFMEASLKRAEELFL